MAKKRLIDENLLTQCSEQPIYKQDEEETSIWRMIDNIDEPNMLLLPLEDEVVLPYMQVGLQITHRQNIKTVKRAFAKKEPLLMFLSPYSLPEDNKDVVAEDLELVRGAVSYINEVTEIEDGSLFITAITGPRAFVFSLKTVSPDLRGVVLYDVPAGIKETKKETQIENGLNDLYKDLTMHLSDTDRKHLQELMVSIDKRSVRWLYFMIQNSPLSSDERYRILCQPDLKKQRDMFIKLVKEQKTELEMREDINRKTASELGRRQRDEFLRTQLQQIKTELGETCETDEEELNERASKMEWTEDAEKRYRKEFARLQRYNPSSPDYAVQFSYLDTYLSLPWLHCDNSDFTLDNVEQVLNRDHYGLEKVKERIIEQMAVLKLRKDTKAPILCLYGPPGVGKTSLGKSVAEALGRKYVRVALGGLHDEAEIRGHRRTYLGSMPGRIINALEKCGTSDPVMVLDEIDKIGADYKGDPAQALLEVLDPEQNCKFHDNYIDQDYDLSKVLFIATANSLSTISPPLLDRMELIEISGYIEAEKIQIAQRHIIGKSLEEHGFDKDDIKFTDEALMLMITDYTRESGVRRLEKKINEVIRKQARLKAADKPYPHTIDVEEVRHCLGKPEAFSDVYENNRIAGIVTGLAWTQTGGEILFVESSTSPGKDCKLALTGNLGDVMKESAIIALQYIKSNHERLGIPESALEVGTVHVHVPEGAVPKDGPSAGITIATSLASTFTRRKVRSHLAMTGEMTLRGKVLPVGGIKEKILAAKRAGIKTVMLCEKNRKDIEEIKPEYIDGLDFHYVTTVAEALEYALLDEQAES